MASPLPSSDPKTAVVMGYPAPHTLPEEHCPGKQAPDLPCSPHASRSNPQPQCTCIDWKSELPGLCLLVTALSTFGVALMALLIFATALIGPEYPVMKVAGLSVSNLTIAGSSRATWRAALLVQKPEYHGKLFFSELECSVYSHWDAAQPLAVAPAEPFVLRSTDRTVIKAKITMEKPAEAVVEGMNRERRSVGTATVKLGVRMQGTYLLSSWWEKGYGSIEAYCDNLTIVFANSTGEGSLVLGDALITRDHLPSDNLPSCSYVGDERRNTF